MGIRLPENISINTNAPNNARAGQVWINPDSGVIGFWKSPYWLSTTEYFASDIYRSFSASNTPNGQILIPQLNFSSILLEKISFGTRSALSGCDNNNYWEIQGRYDETGGTTNLPGSLLTINSNLAGNSEVSASINLPVLLSGNTRYFVPPRFLKFGSPSNIDGTWAMEYRLILS